MLGYSGRLHGCDSAPCFMHMTALHEVSSMRTGFSHTAGAFFFVGFLSAASTALPVRWFRILGIPKRHRALGSTLVVGRAACESCLPLYLRPLSCFISFRGSIRGAIGV